MASIPWPFVEDFIHQVALLAAIAVISAAAPTPAYALGTTIFIILPPLISYLRSELHLDPVNLENTPQQFARAYLAALGYPWLRQYVQNRNRDMHRRGMVNIVLFFMGWWGAVYVVVWQLLPGVLYGLLGTLRYGGASPSTVEVDSRGTSAGTGMGSTSTLDTATSTGNVSQSWRETPAAIRRNPFPTPGRTETGDCMGVTIEPATTLRRDE